MLQVLSRSRHFGSRIHRLMYSCSKCWWFLLCETFVIQKSILPLQCDSKFTVLYTHLSGLSIILNACIFGIQTKLSLDAASMSIVHLFCWFWTSVSDASLLILHRLWSVSNKYSFGLVAYCLSLSFFSLFLYNTADLNSFKPKALISKWTSSGPNDLVKNIFYGSEWSDHL